MRFLLDHDVDARVRRVFTYHDHQCWTAAQANLARATDDELTVYATDRGAVVVTHDTEFSQRRATNVIGKHLQLRCAEEDAVELLTLHFEVVIRSLNAADNVLVQVSVAGCTVSMNWT